MRTPPRVFISYSHDSEDHKNHVQELSERLLADGIDCHLDVYEPSPPEGWPRWMSTQIDQAEFVLVICTETYNRRADGKESPGVGHGANWEGLLITQQIFEDAGRNNKFIPVLLREYDALHVPKFLKPYSRYCVETPKGLEDLYRRLTAQPAIVKPPLGPLKDLSGQPQKTDQKLKEDFDKSKIFSTSNEPVVIWRLPRGFLLLDNLLLESNASWSTRAYYVDYNGQEYQGTHYHPSYRWWDKYGAFEGQYAKLQIPRGDWTPARTALQFMVDVRENRCSLSQEGHVTGSFSTNMLRQYHASVVLPGDIPLPKMPAEFRPLSISGPLRDLASEATDLLNEQTSSSTRTFLADFGDRVARIRREVRIEIHRKLSEDHPAYKNLEEIIVQYQPRDDHEREHWLKKFSSATWEAARCIEYQVS
jgi:hypothetical protein